MRMNTIPIPLFRTAAPGPGCPRRKRSLIFGVLLAASMLALCGTDGVATAQPVVHTLALAGSLDDVLTNLRNWLVGILAGVATVCLTVGGVRYLIGASEPGEVERAKTALRAAAVGYVLAMLAPVVVSVLKSIVGG